MHDAFPTVPHINLFNVQPLTPTSALVSWNTSNSLVDTYTVSYTRLCDNIKGTLTIENGTSESILIDSLYPGLQYSISITAANLLGRGMERTDLITLDGSGKHFITNNAPCNGLYSPGPPIEAPLLQPPVIVNSTSVRLSWKKLNCLTHNVSITGYSIQYFIDKNPQPVFLIVPAITSTILTGLNKFCLYYISIAAINNNGIGPYSHEFRFNTS